MAIGKLKPKRTNDFDLIKNEITRLINEQNIPYIEYLKWKWNKYNSFSTIKLR